MSAAGKFKVRRNLVGGLLIENCYGNPPQSELKIKTSYKEQTYANISHDS